MTQRRQHLWWLGTKTKEYRAQAQGGRAFCNDATGDGRVVTSREELPDSRSRRVSSSTDTLGEVAG